MQLKLIENIPFCSVDGSPLCLDIIMTEEAAADPQPAIIYIHGGGWLRGDKAGLGGRDMNARFARHSFVCVNINHRLSGEASFPAQIHDVKAAVRYIRAHAHEYNIDPAKIGIWGHSSGGHLASLLGISAFASELEGDGGNDAYSSEVQAVCTLSGPTDLLQMGGWHDLAHSPEARLFGIRTLADNPQTVALANPIHYVTEKAPPFFIVHGDADSIVPIHQAELLYAALEDASFLRVKGADHGLVGGNLSIDEILDYILLFFRKQLTKTKDTPAQIVQSRTEEKNLIQYFVDQSATPSK
ncbi:alpha/beta hydrolase fold domain-containing protein [Brevibacillus sp. SIMBA_040]|uniref:alpha/beta hydrolase fold domain-containing protein n=2 Tax=Bacillales TaxID=1385 RepID=UPI00397C9647